MMKEFMNCFSFSVSHTTRKIREGEIDGKNYFYIDKQKFETVYLNKLDDWQQTICWIQYL